MSKKILITVSESTAAALAQDRAKTGVPTAEFVRRAICERLEQNAPANQKPEAE